ncbi:MAG: hypothetical protein H7338_13615 [Candidatus Sericytochromatia bacterium]|nr:hypothetical protein [Candidatus Sericytochromatia bacterium]
MIVYLSLALVIGILLLSAIAFWIFAAWAEHRRLLDGEYLLDTSDGVPREMGPEEQGTEAVIQARFAHGEIDRETCQHQVQDLHHPPAA